MPKLAPVATLRKDSEFRRVYRKGKSHATPRIVLYVLKRYIREKDTREVRVGVSVSGKVGKAVIRNKIRRRLKEILRNNPTKIKRGHDLVIVARDAATAAEYWELERDLFYLAEKLGVTTEQTSL